MRLSLSPLDLDLDFDVRVPSSLHLLASVTLYVSSLLEDRTERERERVDDV